MSAAIVGRAGLATAAPPAINNVSLRGLQTGAPMSLVIEGANLLPEPALLNHPATLKPGATEKRVEFELHEGPLGIAGIAPLWLWNKQGVSNAVLMSVDALPQIAHTAKGAVLSLATLPVAVTGEVAGSEVDRFTFAGQQGQRLVIDVEARRLGAKFDPVVRLLDSRGAQVAFSQGVLRLAGDPRLVTTLKAAGTYTIELQDLTFRAGKPGYYRLKVGDLNFTDFALPIGLTAGKISPLTLFTSPTPLRTEALIPAAAVPQLQPVLQLAKPWYTGNGPTTMISTDPEVLHSGGEKPHELPPAPVGASGVIAAPGAEDIYLLPVTPQQKLRFELLAAGLGSPLDGVLTLGGESGNQLAAADDQPGTTDPALDFTVPANVHRLRVKVSEHQRLGGPDYVYHLAVREANRPDFALALDRDRVNIPSGGTATVRVDVSRANFNGPIELAVEHLPAGLQITGAAIPAGANFTLVSFLAPQGVVGAGNVTLVGRAAGVDPPLARYALAAETPPTQLAPWLRKDLAVGVTSAAPLSMTWNVSPDDKLPLGGKYQAQVVLTRTAKGKGPVRFTLLTTQPPVKKKEKKNGKEEESDDVAKMLHLVNPPELAAGATEATLTVAVPANLAAQPWGLAFTAELLNGEKKVVATATTGLKFLPAVKP